MVSGRVGWQSKRVEIGRVAQQDGGDWKGGTATAWRLEGWHSKTVETGRVAQHKG